MGNLLTSFSTPARNKLKCIKPVDENIQNNSNVYKQSNITDDVHVGNKCNQVDNVPKNKEIKASNLIEESSKIYITNKNEHFQDSNGNNDIKTKKKHGHKHSKKKKKRLLFGCLILTVILIYKYLFKWTFRVFNV